MVCLGFYYKSIAVQCKVDMQVKCIYPLLLQQMTQKESAVRVHEDLSAFIIGLPEDIFEDDLAKSKFADTIRFLKEIVPEIEEARCKMKLIHTSGKKNHYQVDVSIITPYKTNAYSNSGWDLAKLFDEMSESLKKRLEQEKRMGHGRVSSRHD